MTELPSHSQFPAWPPPIDLPLSDLGEDPCSYLPGLMTRMRGFLCREMPGELYQELLETGFRRSGELFYQPVCRACRMCIPIRLPVRDFTPSKSQRRIMRRNEDLTLRLLEPVPDDETFAVYEKFMAGRHPQSRQGRDRDTYERFLYTSPMRTVEMRYYTPGGRLVGVGICDSTPKTLSSVYFYFDPAESARGLGTFSQIREVLLAREFGFEYVYLGYWVPGSATMNYKANFRPYEILGTDGIWRREEDPPSKPGRASPQE